MTTVAESSIGKVIGSPRLRVTQFPGGVRMVEDRVPGGIGYLIQGPALGVRACVDQLFKEYHPCGYGTQTVAWESQPLSDWVEAIVHRAASCD